MNKFVVRMLELGAELDKAVSPIEINMVINDAEILYKNHIEQLTLTDVSQQRELLIDFAGTYQNCHIDDTAENTVDWYLRTKDN